MTILYAVLVGGLFGFVLQKIGAANPQRIIDMLRLRDFHLMKAILLGIGISSFILYAGLAAGLIDSAHLSIKSAYVGVVIGGAILGAGWAIAGFCPGTGVAAAGAGRKDALVFLLGGLLGALVFTLLYASISDSFLFNEIAGGKTTLANSATSMLGSLPAELRAEGAAGFIATLFIVVAWLLPKGRSNVQRS